MIIHLPEHLEKFVHAQVQSGRYSSEDAVIRDALEQLRKRATQPMSNAQGSLGAMRDAAEELDEVVAHALEHRKQPWRTLPSE
jgi:putative addiction module CopG family antidote